eukprot:Gb_38656 [translate_table: standard]
MALVFPGASRLCFRWHSLTLVPRLRHTISRGLSTSRAHFFPGSWCYSELPSCSTNVQSHRFWVGVTTIRAAYGWSHECSSCISHLASNLPTTMPLSYLACSFTRGVHQGVYCPQCSSPSVSRPTQDGILAPQNLVEQWYTAKSTYYMFSRCLLAQHPLQATTQRFMYRLFTSTKDFNNTFTIIAEPFWLKNSSNSNKNSP